MATRISERIERLREVMQREGIDAFIFPSTDPHNGEYVPAHWEGRKWISGFDGSAGTAVVTMDKAALWTDSRYFLAAAEQLACTEFQLMKERIEGTPTIAEWLGVVLAHIDGATVGLDGYVNSVGEVEQLTVELRRQGGITIRTNFDPLDKIWSDRPAIPTNPVEIHPLEYAGETAESKLQRIGKELRKSGAEGMLVTALDDIAWSLNLRGSDVHCNPVFVSYLLIDGNDYTLYINSEKLTADVRSYLGDLNVKIAPYEDAANGLKHYESYNILLDPTQANYNMHNAASKLRVVYAPSPVPMMKAVKNATEIDGFHNAMLRDGVALVKFLRWLKPAVEAGGETEISVDRKLTSLRAEQPLFKGVSFDTIAAYQEHGAIVHYEATSATDIPLKPEGFLLLDSGAQYMDGTTDITRTIPLGPVTEEQRHIYTLVLKGHIQLEMCKFPNRASGTQLDALAREAMWREGLNFMHGTGHGVGSYLNVHEGPHQIRMEWKPAPLQNGMTVTDEPGLYLAGKFGVRIENTLLVKDFVETEFGKFLQFEPLTLCPIDMDCIDSSMLTDEERQWLNEYHTMVYNKLAPLLDEADREWLKQNTQKCYNVSQK